jgi:hypothetical protein
VRLHVLDISPGGDTHPPLRPALCPLPQAASLCKDDAFSLLLLPPFPSHVYRSGRGPSPGRLSRGPGAPTGGVGKDVYQHTT